MRRVTSRANNVSGAYPSRKMGVTIQFESQNPELWAIVMMDHDESVLEFFEQPDTFKIRYLDKSGKKMQGHYYTPDFLVLRNDSVCFEEWKREDDLKRLAARYPFRYQPQEDGSWRCPPAEEAVSALGLTFRVRSSAELHPTYVDNLLFLEDYFDMTVAPPVQVQTTILKLIRETPGLPLSALAADAAMQQHGVRVLFVDEAHHMLYGKEGTAGSALQEQLEWLKSLGSQTGVLYILVGTYDLFNFGKRRAVACQSTFPATSWSERRIALSSRVHSSNCCDACRWNAQPNGG